MSVVKRFLLIVCLVLPGQLQAAAVVGEVAPELSLPEVVGEETISPSSLRGKVVYVDFWAAWCGPCRVSFPQLQLLRDDLGEKGFEVLAISVDEQASDARAFLEEVPVTYPVVHDGEGVTPAVYGVLGMPTGYLIDREGVVRDIHQGYRKSDGEKLRAKIVTLLGEE